MIILEGRIVIASSNSNLNPSCLLPNILCYFNWNYLFYSRIKPTYSTVPLFIFYYWQKPKTAIVWNSFVVTHMNLFKFNINWSTLCQICVCAHVSVRVVAIKDIISKLLCHMRRSHKQIEMAQHAVTYQSTTKYIFI